MGYTFIIKRLDKDMVNLILWSNNGFNELYLSNKDFMVLKKTINDFENDKGD